MGLRIETRPAAADPPWPHPKIVALILRHDQTIGVQHGSYKAGNERSHRIAEMVVTASDQRRHHRCTSRAPSLLALISKRKVHQAAPRHLVQRHFAIRKRCKNQCANKPLRPRGARERQFALSCLPNRAGKVNSFLRFSSTPRKISIAASLHLRRTNVSTPRLQWPSPGGVHAFLRVQHFGCRMLFIRFVNRAVQAVWRSHHGGRKQARDSGHSPFRGPARGRSPRARISNVGSFQQAGCNPSATLL